MPVDKTKPFVGYMFLELRQEGSPTTYARICEATGISGIGEANAQVDSTTFCSGGTREFIAGLAEGSEIQVDMNYIVSSTVRRQLLAAVKSRQTVGLRFVVDQEGQGTFDEEYVFEAAALSWSLNPSIDDKNQKGFTLKISGEIDYIDHYSASL